MLQKQEIIGKLKKIGFKEKNIAKVYIDVNEVIFSKFLGQYVTRLPIGEQSLLLKMPPGDLVAYFKEHKEQLPPFSQQEFDQIYTDTWADYFRSVA